MGKQCTLRIETHVSGMSSNSPVKPWPVGLSSCVFLLPRSALFRWPLAPMLAILGTSFGSSLLQTKTRWGGLSSYISTHPFYYPTAFKDLAPKWVKFSMNCSFGWVTEVGLLRQVWQGILWSSSSWATPASGRQGVLLRNVEIVPDQHPFHECSFLSSSGKMLVPSIFIDILCDSMGQPSTPCVCVCVDHTSEGPRMWNVHPFIYTYIYIYIYIHIWYTYRHMFSSNIASF